MKLQTTLSREELGRVLGNDVSSGGTGEMDVQYHKGGGVSVVFRIDESVVHDILKEHCERVGFSVTSIEYSRSGAIVTLEDENT